MKEEKPVEFLLVLLPATTSIKIEEIDESFCALETSNIKMSMKIHPKQNFKQFKCNLCEKKYFYKHELKRHLWNHRDEKRYTCEICGRGFNYNAHLKEHRLSHIDPRPFKCDLCVKTYLNKQMLQQHLEKSHHKLENFREHFEEKSECKLCKKSFCDKTLMKRHIERFHGKGNLWPFYY